MSSRLTVVAVVTDKRMRQWSVALQANRRSGCQTAEFGVWPVGRVAASSRPIGSACCIVDKSGDAKLEDFTIDPPYQNTGIGSALLAEVETWAVRAGIGRLYGDLARVDSAHFTMLRHLYTKHGWKWCVFCEGDPRLRPTSHVVGVVEKAIVVEESEHGRADTGLEGDDY